MPKDMDHYRKVNVEYTQAAVNTFATSLAPQLGPGEKFRFAYCSGIAAERDQEKKLWFMQEGRRIRVRLQHLFLTDRSINAKGIRATSKMSSCKLPRTMEIDSRLMSFGRVLCYPRERLLCTPL